MGYLYILGSILSTVAGQLLIKWQLDKRGPAPLDLNGKVFFYLHILISPWVLCAMLFGFLAFFFWLLTLSKFELSYAYPFMSLTFVLTFVLSVLIFHDTVTPAKVIGLACIIAGLIIGSVK